MARFRPLAIPLTPPLDGADADAREWDFFNEVLWHMQIPCCLLPDMRYSSGQGLSEPHTNCAHLLMESI